MQINLTENTTELFDRWSKVEDYRKRAPEELAEAIVAISHHSRHKISDSDLLEELADGIISLVHIAYVTGQLPYLKWRIEQKLKKAEEHADAR